jgi:hypothetical protein
VRVIVRLKLGCLMGMVVRLACVIDMLVVMRAALVGTVGVRVGVLMKV